MDTLDDPDRLEDGDAPGAFPLVFLLGFLVTGGAAIAWMLRENGAAMFSHWFFHPGVAFTVLGAATLLTGIRSPLSRLVWTCCVWWSGFWCAVFAFFCVLPCVAVIPAMLAGPMLEAGGVHPLMAVALHMCIWFCAREVLRYAAGDAPEDPAFPPAAGAVLAGGGAAGWALYTQGAEAFSRGEIYALLALFGFMVASLATDLRSGFSRKVWIWCARWCGCWSLVWALLALVMVHPSDAGRNLLTDAPLFALPLSLFHIGIWACAREVVKRTAATAEEPDNSATVDG